MPKPLSDGQVEYTDGTPATVPQYSKDVIAFLYWASEPTLAERKKIGLRVMVFLIVLSVLLYFTKKQILGKGALKNSRLWQQECVRDWPTGLAPDEALRSAQSQRPANDEPAAGRASPGPLGLTGLLSASRTKEWRRGLQWRRLSWA